MDYGTNAWSLNLIGTREKMMKRKEMKQEMMRIQSSYVQVLFVSSRYDGHQISKSGTRGLLHDLS